MEYIWKYLCIAIGINQRLYKYILLIFIKCKYILYEITHPHNIIITLELLTPIFIFLLYLMCLLCFKHLR